MVVNRVGGRRQRSAVVALNAQDQRRAGTDLLESEYLPPSAVS